jgi:hypothetical protein
MPLLCFMVEKNPNDVTGGGGSLSGEMQDADAKGPFFVWPAQEFESPASPHAVVAASEVEHMYRMLHSEQALSGGEGSEVTETVPAGAIPHQDESPTYDLEDDAQQKAFLAAFGPEG